MGKTSEELDEILKAVDEWAANEERPATVSGHGVLDVTVWMQKQSVTVHLVNLTNPMMMKGPLREVIPVGPQKLRLRMPTGLRARATKLLVARTTVPARQDGEWLDLVVPSIAEHEVVAVDV